MTRTSRLLIVAFGTLTACSGIGAYQDNYYVLDPPLHNLRGKTQADDKSEDLCNPKADQTGKLKYECVVHFNKDYQALLDENSRLQTALDACERGK